jgi:hypothetical protein
MILRKKNSHQEVREEGSFQRIAPWPSLSVSRNVCVYVPFPCPGPRGASPLQALPPPKKNENNLAPFKKKSLKKK